MAGRHKREYEVKAYLLRLPPALIDRMDICCSMLDVATRQRLPRNSRLQMALEEWCARVENEAGQQTPAPVIFTATVLPDAPTSVSEPAPDPQPVLEPPQRQPTTPQKQEENEALERILAAREEHDKLSLWEFAQLLYDRDIYRSLDRRTREQKPLDSGTLKRWLAQAGMS